MYYRIKQLTLALGDLVMLFAGLYLGLAIRHQQFTNTTFNKLLPYMVPLFLVAVIILFVIGLYDIGKARNSIVFYQKIALAAATWLLICVLFFYTSPTTKLTPKTTLLLIGLSGFGLLSLWRSIYNRFIARAFLKTKIMFVGLPKEAEEIIRLLQDQPEQGYRVLGAVAESSSSSVSVANNINDLVAKTEYPDTIIIAPGMANDPRVVNDLYQALFRQTSIITLDAFYEQIFGRVPPFIFSEAWFSTNLHEQEKKMYDRARILADYLVALLMALVFLITFPLIALIIKITSPGPILFSQTRVGRNEKKFTIYKYRTMYALGHGGSAETAGPQFAKENDKRITPFGRFLRRTRLDEVPQFYNILRGEMGLIGPRPERPEFVTELKQKMPFYALRHLIKPGMTGWAQLHRSYYGTITENLLKLQYDLFYVKNRSPLLDLSIALKTINVLIRFIGR